MKRARQFQTTEKGNEIQQRVVLLLEEAERLFRTNIEGSVELSLKAIKESRDSGKKELLAASLAIGGTSYLILEELHQSETYSFEAQKIYESLGDRDAALDAEHKVISAKLFSGNEKNLLIRLHEILNLRLTTAYHTSKTETVQFFIPRSWKDRIKGIIPDKKEIEKQHQFQLIELYGTLARAYSLIDPQKAISYLETEIAIAKKLKDKPYLSLGMNNLGTIYTVLGNHALARQYLERTLQLDEQMGHERGKAAVQKNLALLYIDTGQIALARQYSKLAIKGFRKLKLWEAVSQTYISLAIYERVHGSLAKALEYSTEAWELLKEREKSVMYYFVLMEHLLTLHANSPSEKYYKKLCRLYEDTKEKNLELQYVAAQEIARIAQERKLHSESLRWLNIVHAHEIEKIKESQQHALQKIEIEQELAKIEQVREVQRLKMQNLELELKSKSHETEFLAAQLAKKSSLFAELIKELQSLGPEANIGKAIERIESIRFRDSEFEQLEKRISSQHQKFLIVLAEKYPSLTGMEKKICVLLKIGLKPADIAGILFISRRTVETHCLSIRKKLRIQKKMRLLPHIQQL